MSSIRRSLALGATCAVSTQAVMANSALSLSANPIRKVVTMIQRMQKQVEQQGEKEKDLFEKFMCYCQSGTADLEKSISDAENKIPQLESAIKAMDGEVLQLKADLKQHKKDRADAKKAIAEATSIREKEAASFAKVSSEFKTNIAAMTKAVAALEKGMTGFLQTNAASYLRKLTQTESISDENREVLTEFLSQTASSEYAPSSGQIVGILKQMLDTMTGDLSEATQTENAAIKVFEELMAAKTKQIDALTEMIEDKTQRVGESGVKVVEMAEDLEDTKEDLAADQKFLAELEKGCSTKEAEWAERSKIRSQELVALSETIKILNDDDALELFKKTLPGSASFMQVSVTHRDVVAHAVSMLHNFGHTKDYRMDAILLALRGKTVDFSKVIEMIDNMVSLLGKEQGDDDAKLEQCKTDLDLAEDKKKELERSISLLDKRIDDDKSAIATLTDEIDALVAGVKALDKEVAERTDVRKEENSDFITAMAQHKTAHELLSFAKNRMNKFYNPKLYKPAPKREMSEEERLTVNFGGTLAPTAAPAGIAGTGISFMQIDKAAPPPPPETWGAYNKASEAGNGVISMMDMLLKDLDTEMTEMQVTEQQAQEEYEEFMTDAAAKRVADGKSITDKTAVKADTNADLEDAKSDHKTTVGALMANDKATMALHSSCDWLMQYYDVRKEARTGEIGSLKNAKAVLSGANYS